MEPDNKNNTGRWKMNKQKNARKMIGRSFVASAFLTLLGCNDNTNKAQEEQVDAREQLTIEVRELVTINELAGLTRFSSALPSHDAPIALLGKQLFFAKSLSGDMDTACASCHHPFLGGGDDLSLSIGVGAVQPDLLGPGREHDPSAYHADGGPTVPRNAPTTFNIAFYNRTLFHDGRVQSLAAEESLNGFEQPIRTPDTAFGNLDASAGSNLTAAQARFPVTSSEEMRGFNFANGESNQTLREMLAARLRGETGELAENHWLEAFSAGFGVSPDEVNPAELITFDNIALALGEYQRSQVLIDSPWNRFVAGDDLALEEDQLKGAKLFYISQAEGGFGCVSCHTGDFMTDEAFHVIAMPQVGRGKGNGDTGTEDFGRYRETQNEADRFAFRTPHLTNVEMTGPYGHDGAFLSLEEVVRHHLNPEASIANYDPSAIQSGIQTSYWLENSNRALDKLNSLIAEGNSKLAPVQYTDEQVGYVVAFLKALTDPCTKDRECLNKWVPSAEQDADNTLLMAQFQD